MRAKVAAFVESPRLPLWLALISALLTAPSLFAGLCTEDWVFRDFTRGPFTLAQVNLYGGPDLPGLSRLAQIAGIVPWVGSEKLFLSFWRPLASLTHQFDYRLLDGFPALMHAESIAVHALAVFAAAKLYLRLLEPRRVAALAAVFFAFDHAQGHAVGWLANRNAVLAAAFGLLALYAHDRFRRDGYRPGSVLAPLFVGLALLSGELGLGVLGYFMAHALFLDRAAPLRRALALLPTLAVTAAWAVAYRLLGHGAHDSGIYLDPLRQPVAFLAALPDRFGALVLGQLALPPSDLWTWLPDRTRPLLAVGGLVLLSFFVAAARKRLAQSAELRFCLGGAVLSLLPACTTFPSDRILVFGAFGLFGLLAALACGELSRAARPLIVALAGFHLFVAPVLLPVRSLTMAYYHRYAMRLSDTAYAPIHAPDERLVVMNAPNYYVASLIRNLQFHGRHNQAPPMICLAGTLDPVAVRRIDENTIEMRTRTSFLSEPFNQIYRSRDEPSHVGESFNIGTAEVTITEVTPRGEPRAASFRFVWPLDSEKLKFVIYRDGRYVRALPPATSDWVVIHG
jgi:hypothetical protein